jgi:hypothetical protein
LQESDARNMTRSEEIKAIIARLYAARKNGDLDAILRFFDDMPLSR